MKTPGLYLGGKKVYLSWSKCSLEQGRACSFFSGTIHGTAWCSPCGCRQAHSPRSSWSGLRRCSAPGKPKWWLKLYCHSLDVLTQLAHFALLGRPPKKSAVSSLSCSSWICRDFTWHQNMSALLEPESSSLPGGSPGRLCPRAKGEGLLSVALDLQQGWCAVISRCADFKCLWMVV